jgi:hypothetical protein
MSISLQPANQNLAQSAKFQLNFERLPYLTFFCTSVNLPGLSIDPQVQKTLFVESYVPGDKLHYQNLGVKFLIDEDYRSWESVHDWVRGMAFPVNFQEYKDLKLQQRQPLASSIIKEDKPQYSDAILSIYTNKNNPHIQIRFRDCFPISLSSVDFNVENNADTILTGDASFKFTYYDIIRV